MIIAMVEITISNAGWRKRIHVADIQIVGTEALFLLLWELSHLSINRHN